MIYRCPKCGMRKESKQSPECPPTCGESCDNIVEMVPDTPPVLTMEEVTAVAMTRGGVSSFGPSVLDFANDAIAYAWEKAHAANAG